MPVTRVIAAMSGGVDSSVAAALLVEQGYEVVGAWMRMHDVADYESPHHKACCSLDAADDARRVAGQLGIPFTIVNMEREYAEHVLEPFLAGYLAGRTPSPCVDCNTYVKFGALLARAARLFDCDAVATGHYARIEALEDPTLSGGRRYRLLRGRDAAKDQSYFLHALTQAQLARTLFPIGDRARPKSGSSPGSTGSRLPRRPSPRSCASSPAATTARSLRIARAGGRRRGRCSTSTGRAWASIAASPPTRWGSVRASASRWASRGSSRGWIPPRTSSNWGAATTCSGAGSASKA
jgi:tRNA-specific 2-thiouridylase